MKTYILIIWITLLLISRTAFPQSVLIEPGRQGINSTNTPKGTIELNGNGMLIQQNYKLSNENPETNTVNLLCGSTHNLSAPSGIILDPNGENPYLPGIELLCPFTISVADPAAIGIKITILESNFGTGDRLYNSGNYIPFLNSQDSHIGESFIIQNTTLFFYFQTNTDQSVGQGFKIQWQAIYPDQTDDPLKNIGQLSKFAVDFNKHIFRFGKPHHFESFEPNSIAIGNRAYAPENSIAIGNNVQAFNGGIVLGNNSYTDVFEGIVIGQNSESRFGGIVIGESDSDDGIAIGYGNQANYGAAIGYGNQLFQGFAFGSNLSNSGAHNTLVGKFNGNSRIIASNSTNPIFELGNGTSTTDRHNAVTVLDNGNTGLGVYQPTENLDIEKNAKIRGNLNVLGNFNMNGDLTINEDLKVGDLSKSSRLLIGDIHDYFNMTGTRFLLHNANSGTVTSSSVHLARIENNNDAFLTFSIPADKKAGIQFMKPTTAGFSSEFVGSIRLSESNTFDFRLGENSTRMRLTPQGDLQIGMGVSSNGCLKDGNGTIIAGTCASDSRYKKDIISFQPLLEDFVKLNPVNFNWRTEEFPEKGFGQKPSYGFIAQEVEKIFPELVQTDEKGFKAVNYGKLNIMSIQAIKELKQENEELRALLLKESHSIDKLESKIDLLSEKLLTSHSK